MLVAIEALLLARRLRDGVLHAVLVAVLAGAVVLQLLVDLFEGPAGVLIALAVLAGLAVVFAYVRTRIAPAILTVLAPVPLLFLVYCLMLTPLSKLVLPQDEAAGASDVGNGAPVVVVVFDELSSASLDGPSRRDRPLSLSELREAGG